MRVNRSPVRIGASVAAAATLLAVLGATGAAGAAPGPAGRVTIGDARPGWATASADRGAAAAGTRVRARVYLAGRDPKGLTDFVAAVSDPKSRDYQRFLTPARYRARFGPTRPQVAAVRSWLTSAGLTVTRADQHAVSVRGPAAAAEKAFGTAIHDFTDRTAGGARHYAPTGRVTVPAAVARAVLGVTGLDNGTHRAKPASLNDADDVTQGAPATRKTADGDTLPGPGPVVMRPGPCSRFFGEKKATDKPATYGRTGDWTLCGYTPRQFRSAYGLTSGPTGAGQTVATVLPYASPTIDADMRTFAGKHGSPQFRPGQFTQNRPAAWRGTSECYGVYPFYREEAIDVTALHDVAPDAHITYVAAASCSKEDMLGALSRIVDDKLATIVNNSWNWDEESTSTPAERDAYEQVFKQGAAEGIGFYFSSGDCGADDPATPCPVYSDGPYTEFPPADPYVTAVGGTSMAVGADGGRLWQTGWNDVYSGLTADGSDWTPKPGTGYPAAFGGGSGGGTSKIYGQPAYQATVVPSGLATKLPDGTPLSRPMRVVPDVAADGDNNTGILVGQTQHFNDGGDRYYESRWGGTSLAAPLFAGIQALAQQAAGRPFGFANPALYAKHGTPAFDDVTDTPNGDTPLGVVRNDYADPTDANSKVSTRVATFGRNGLLHATPGYDNVTGLGSPGLRYVRSWTD